MRYSNESAFWLLGKNEKYNCWQLRKSTPEDPSKHQLIALFKNDSWIRTMRLEFNGYFARSQSEQKDLLLTQGRPWVASISNDSKLRVGQFDSNYQVTWTLISDAVLDASLCRGFCDEELQYDSGLCLAYVKTDGTVWYTSYLNVSGEVTWSNSEQLVSLGTGNTRVQVVRLNDYRFGIYADGSNYLAVSTQNRIGNSVKFEYAQGVVKSWSVCAFTQENDDDTELELDSFLFCRNPDNEVTSVIVTFNHSITDLDPGYIIQPFSPASIGVAFSSITSSNDGFTWTFDLAEPVATRVIRIAVSPNSHFVYNTTPQRTLRLPSLTIICSEDYNVTSTEYADEQLSLSNVSLCVTDIETTRKNLGTESAASISNIDNVTLILSAVQESERRLNTEYARSLAALGNIQFTTANTGVTPT